MGGKSCWDTVNDKWQTLGSKWHLLAGSISGVPDTVGNVMKFSMSRLSDKRTIYFMHFSDGHCSMILECMFLLGVVNAYREII